MTQKNPAKWSAYFETMTKNDRNLFNSHPRGVGQFHYKKEQKGNKKAPLFGTRELKDFIPRVV